MTRLLLPAFVIFMFSCQPASTSETTSDSDTVEIVANEDEGIAEHIRFLHEKRAAEFNKFPIVTLPFKFNYDAAAGTEVTGMEEWYHYLQPEDLQPKLKRVLGVVKTDTANFVFWIGALYDEENKPFWRAYYTSTIDNEPWKTSLIDASQQDNERCSPTVTEHWTIVNKQLESRSVINIQTECTDDSDGESVRTMKLTLNAGAIPAPRAHLFTGTRALLPSSRPQKINGLLTYYEAGMMNSEQEPLYFPTALRASQRTYSIEKISNVPGVFDTLTLLGMLRAVTGSSPQDKEYQFSLIAAKKINDKQQIIGKPFNMTLPVDLSTHHPVFEFVSDRFLRIYDIEVPQSPYEYYVTLHNYDLVSLADLDLSSLRIHRNYLFAKRGQVFNSPDLAEYFKQFYWYTPEFNELTENELSHTEKALLRYIQNLESKF